MKIFKTILVAIAILIVPVFVLGGQELDSNGDNRLDSSLLPAVYEYEWIPIEACLDGAAPPAATSAISNSGGKVAIRNFSSSTTEDVQCSWQVPADIDATSGVSFRVVSWITSSTGPSSEGVAFDLAGNSVGNGDALDENSGTAQESNATGQTHAQYDRLQTAWSSAITITDLAAGESVQLKLERDHDDADDDYGQDIGVEGFWLRYVVDTDAP